MVTIYPRVFIANLPFSVGSEELKQLASPAGKVTWAKVNKNHQGRSLGTGTVQFSNYEEAINAVLRLDGSFNAGRKLQAKPSLWSSGTEDYVEDDVATAVFVTNLPYNANAMVLNDLFGEAGDIVRSVVYTDPQCRSRGIATVVYKTLAEAEKAIEMFDGHKLENRELTVRPERVKRNQPFEWCSGYGDASNTLFVSNLAFDITEAELTAFFEPVDRVLRVRLQEFAPKVFTGNAIVRLPSEASASKALEELNNKELKGREVKISYARYLD